MKLLNLSPNCDLTYNRVHDWKLYFDIFNVTNGTKTFNNNNHVYFQFFLFLWFWCEYDFSIYFWFFFLSFLHSNTQCIKPISPKWSQRTIFLMWKKVFYFFNLSTFFCSLKHFLLQPFSNASFICSNYFQSLAFLVSQWNHDSFKINNNSHVKQPILCYRLIMLFWGKMFRYCRSFFSTFFFFTKAPFFVCQNAQRCLCHLSLLAKD